MAADLGLNFSDFIIVIPKYDDFLAESGMEDGVSAKISFGVSMAYFSVETIKKVITATMNLVKAVAAIIIDFVKVVGVTAGEMKDLVSGDIAALKGDVEKMAEDFKADAAGAGA